MLMEQCMLPEDYEYKLINFEPKEGDNYTLSCKIKNVRTEDDVKKWLKDYEDKTKFTWRIARTIKSAGRSNVYRLDLRCQHKTDARFRKAKKKSTKNTDCPATLKIVIKRYFDAPKLKKPDEETKMFPCIIDLHSWHNHCSNSAAVLTCRDMSETTKEKLLHFFQTGHTAATARHALQTELVLENSDNYDLVSADSSILPSLSTIQHLFNETFLNVYGAKKGSDALNDLKKLIVNYCDTTEGRAAVQAIESHVVIAICTPIMQRTIETLPQVQELVLVDASGNMDNMNHRVYFFLSPTVAGGSPIGCIITDAEKEVLFKAGVQLLNTCFPSSFANGPKVFMIDGDLKERKVLHEIWPNARLLLCQFHVLKAAWRWVSDPKHSISKEDRPAMYFLIKEMVYAETEDILNEKMKNLKLNIHNEKFLKYVIHLWETKHLWASCYRRGLPIRGNNTNNYIEALFRILKDVILDRVKAHNLIQLTDFILTKYELYLNQRYLDFSFGRYSKNLLKKFLIEDKSLISKNNIKFDEEKDIYIIESDKGMYFVDVHNCFCSCYSGCTGQLCKHIASVVNLENIKLDSKFWYSDSLKSIMYKIATGKEIQKDFLMPLTYNPNAPKQLHKSEPTNPFSLPYNECIDTALINTETHTSQNTETHTHTSQNTETLSTDVISEQEKENIKRKFEEWYNKVCYGLEHNSEIYFPAVNKMLANDEKYASTETGLISALHNYAKYEGPRTQSVKYSKRKGKQIAVQPTAIGRRKLSLSGKRKVSAGRPPLTSKIPINLKDHTYTNFGTLPKKKAPHNLTACVEKNVTLGN